MREEMENDYFTWLGSPSNRAYHAAKLSRLGTGNGASLYGAILSSILTNVYPGDVG